MPVFSVPAMSNNVFFDGTPLKANDVCVPVLFFVDANGKNASYTGAPITIRDASGPTLAGALAAAATGPTAITVSGLGSWTDEESGLASVAVYCGETDPADSATFAEWVALPSTATATVPITGGVAADSVEFQGLAVGTAHHVRSVAQDTAGFQTTAEPAVFADVAAELRVASTERTAAGGDTYLASDSVLSVPGPWMPSSHNVDQWIQFDLGATRQVLGVAARGRDAFLQYIRSFRVAAQDQPGDVAVTGQVGWPADGDQAWQTLQTDLTDQNYNTTVTLTLATGPLVGRYVRVNPLSWRDFIAGSFDILVAQPVFTLPDVDAPAGVGDVTIALGSSDPTAEVLVSGLQSVSDNDELATLSVKYGIVNDAADADTATVTISLSGGTAVSDTHLVTGLSPDTPYYFWTQATDASGNDSGAVATTPGSVTTDATEVPPEGESVVPALTSDVDQGYTVTASSVYSQFGISEYRAFDRRFGIENSGWAAADTRDPPHFVAVQMPSAVTITGFRLWSALPTGSSVSLVRSFRIEGSNDGTSWTSLGEFNSVSHAIIADADKATTDAFQADFDVDDEVGTPAHLFQSELTSPGSYTHYRIYVTAQDAGIAHIAELVLLSTEPTVSTAYTGTGLAFVDDEFTDSSGVDRVYTGVWSIPDDTTPSLNGYAAGAHPAQGATKATLIVPLRVPTSTGHDIGLAFAGVDPAVTNIFTPGLSYDYSRTSPDLMTRFNNNGSSGVVAASPPPVGLTAQYHCFVVTYDTSTGQLGGYLAVTDTGISAVTLYPFGTATHTSKTPFTEFLPVVRDTVSGAYLRPAEFFLEEILTQAQVQAECERILLV
eukprot:jgi/Tetstr1/447304/TSEL_034741.t1